MLQLLHTHIITIKKTSRLHKPMHYFNDKEKNSGQLFQQRDLIITYIHAYHVHIHTGATWMDVCCLDCYRQTGHRLIHLVAS